MTYEICKKLKDAGWNKKTYWFYGINETDMPQLTNQYSCLDTVGITFVNGLSEKIVDCYAPDLSELLEACGDKFFELSRVRKYITGEVVGGWKAIGAKSGHSGGSAIEIINELTPEEAVANLWLKLNAK